MYSFCLIKINNSVLLSLKGDEVTRASVVCSVRSDESSQPLTRTGQYVRQMSSLSSASSHHNGDLRKSRVKSRSRLLIALEVPGCIVLHCMAFVLYGNFITRLRRGNLIICTIRHSLEEMPYLLSILSTYMKCTMAQTDSQTVSRVVLLGRCTAEEMIRKSRVLKKNTDVHVLLFSHQTTLTDSYKKMKGSQMGGGVGISVRHVITKYFYEI